MAITELIAFPVRIDDLAFASTHLPDETVLI
jgi:hypothetical protein